MTKREAEGGGRRAGAGGWRRRGAARLQIGDSRFQKEEFRSQVAEEQGLGGAARLQIGDSRFQKEEFRSQELDEQALGALRDCRWQIQDFKKKS